MSDDLKQQISALVDDELSVQEQPLLLKRLGQDRELARCWQRYHLISDALRQHLPEHPSEELADRVMAALDNEPAYHERGGRTLPGWMKPLAGVAVAASVAVVAVLSVRNTTEENAVPAVAQVQTPASSDYLRVEGTQWNVAQPEVANQLNNYLVNHSEFAATSGVPGMLPYVRIVGYDQAPE